MDYCSQQILATLFVCLALQAIARNHPAPPALTTADELPPDCRPPSSPARGPPLPAYRRLRQFLPALACPRPVTASTRAAPARSCPVLTAQAPPLSAYAPPVPALDGANRALPAAHCRHDTWCPAAHSSAKSKHSGLDLGIPFNIPVQSFKGTRHGGILRSVSTQRSFQLCGFVVPDVCSCRHFFTLDLMTEN